MGGESWLLDITRGRFRFARRDAAPPHKYVAAYSPKKVIRGRWYHVAAVDSGTGLAVYVNGAKGTEAPYPAKASLVNDHAVAFGCRQSKNGSYDCGVAGAIDEAAVWRRALTADEVAGLYARHAAAAARTPAVPARHSGGGKIKPPGGTGNQRPAAARDKKTRKHSKRKHK